VDGNEMDGVYKDAEKIYEVIEKYEIGEVLMGESEKQKEELWLLRRKVPYAVRHNSVYKEEDTVVPHAQLPQLLKGVKDIGLKYGFKSVYYGHAGDGNPRPRLRPASVRYMRLWRFFHNQAIS